MLDAIIHIEEFDGVMWVRIDDPKGQWGVSGSITQIKRIIAEAIHYTTVYGQDGDDEIEAFKKTYELSD